MTNTPQSDRYIELGDHNYTRVGDTVTMIICNPDEQAWIIIGEFTLQEVVGDHSVRIGPNSQGRDFVVSPLLLMSTKSIAQAKCDELNRANSIHHSRRVFPD